MKIYACELCGYEYNPNRGDTENGIEPETDFSELPEDWTCPMCGASKDDFDVIGDTAYGHDDEEDEDGCASGDVVTRVTGEKLSDFRDDDAG